VLSYQSVLFSKGSKRKCEREREREREREINYAVTANDLRPINVATIPGGS